MFLITFRNISIFLNVKSHRILTWKSDNEYRYKIHEINNKTKYKYENIQSRVLVGDQTNLYLNSIFFFRLPQQKWKTT